MASKIAITMENKTGEIVAKLYVPDGKLHEDSWICPAGWK